MLEDALAYGRAFTDQGRTAQYIPYLRHVDRDLLGVSVRTVDGRRFSAGFGMVGALANLGKLVRAEAEDDTSGIEPSGQHVIRLPHTGTTH